MEQPTTRGLGEQHGSRYLRQLLQTIPVGVVTVDANGVVLGYNQAADDILSFDRSEDAEKAAKDAPNEVLITGLFGKSDRLARLIEGGFDGETRSGVFERRGPRGLQHVEITTWQLSIQDDESVGMLILQDVTTRTAAEKGLKRAVLDREFLTQSGAELSKSLEYQTTLEAFARLAVTYLCDWCTVNMIEDDGSVGRAAVAHVDPAKEALIVELHRSHPHDPNATTGVPQVMRTGKPELFAEVDNVLLELTANNPDYLRIVMDLGMHSCMIVPLIAHGETLGAVSLVSARRERRYDSSDLELACEMARRAGLAVHNARLFQKVEESRAKFASMARILQRSLLPPELPSMPGLDAAALYRPATESLEVGGDFYDLFETSGGRWGIVMGDVQGHGAAAAATTALARYTLRANAMRLTRPVHVLYQVNKTLMQHSGERFLSAVFATMSLEPTVRVTIASAGHPKPMLLRADGRVESVGGEGILLGLFAAPDLNEQDVELEPGDALVLFTDGLTEAGAPRNMLGEEGFRQVLSRCEGLGASEICASIGEVLMTWQGEKGHRDDCAALVLRVNEDAQEDGRIPESASTLL